MKGGEKVKYRKKPVVIEAYKLTKDNMEFIEEWCHGSIKGISLPLEDRVIDIQTLEGEMRANLGDYIIKGIQGEFYPCKPDIFEQTYDIVAELVCYCDTCKDKIKCQEECWLHCPYHDEEDD